MAKNIKRTTVGSNLVSLRKKSPFSQQDIAEKIGVTRDAYAKYETTVTPPLEKLIALCEVFNVTIDELASGSNSYTQSPQQHKAPVFTASSPYLSGFECLDGTELQLTADEVELLLKYRECTDEKKEEILGMFE